MPSWCLSRKRMAARGLLALALLSCAVGLRAQGAQAKDEPVPDAPAPMAKAVAAQGTATATLPEGPAASARTKAAADSLPRRGNRGDEGEGEETRQARPRESGLVFSLWDRSPQDALRGAAEGGGGRPASGHDALHGFESLNRGSSGMGIGADDRGVSAPGMGQGGMGAGRRGGQGELNLNRLTRGSAGMNVNPAAGKFSLAYQDALSATAYGSPGDMGMSSARAMFTSPTFDNGLFDFSSSFEFGSGSSMISTHNGFSAGVLRGSGVGGSQFGPGIGAGGKKPSSSLSVKLSF